MRSRSAILLLATALSSWAVPATAQEKTTSAQEAVDLDAQIDAVDPDAVDPMAAVSKGFADTWARADKSLKVAPARIDADFLLVEVTLPWQAPDPARTERFASEAPPAVPDVEWPSDNLEAWLEYLSLKSNEAAEASDRQAFRSAVEDALFIGAASATSFSIFGPESDKYLGSLAQLITGLDPNTQTSEQEILGLLADDAETKKALRARLLTQRSSLPAAEKSLLLTAGAQYLALAANGKSLDATDVPIIEQRIDLLIDAGRQAEADRLLALAVALKRNENIDHYNQMVNFRHQNIEIFAFDTAAAWDLSGLKAARAFMEPKDPLLLRYALLVAADAVAGDKGELAEEALVVARAACAAQACGSLEQSPGYREGLALLEAAKLKAASQRFASAVVGSGSASDPADEKLAVLTLERGQCYATAEAENRGGTQSLTRAGELTAARCDLRFGTEMLRIREARGETTDAQGKYRDLLQQVAEASFKLGDWKAAAASFGKLYPILSAEKASPINLTIASALLAQSQIALRDFAGADRTLASKRADAKQMYVDGGLIPLWYRNELEAMAALQVERLLAEEGRAAEAFEGASKLAARERTFREGLSADVRDETVLSRALANANSFTPLLDAAYAKRKAAPGDADAMLAAAFLAAQDATLDPTSIAIAMSAAAESSVAGDPELAKLVQRRRQLLDELAPHIGVDAQARLALDVKAELLQRQEQAAIERKQQEFDQIGATLRERFPEYFELIRPRAVEINEAKALMNGDEATLVVVPTERGTHSMLLTREGVSWHRAPIDARTLSDQVQRLLWFAGGAIRPDDAKIGAWSSQVDGGKKGFDRDTAHSVYQSILAPHGAAFAGKRKLYISALGALSSLPFGMLVTEAPQGRDDDMEALRATKWLLDDFVLAQIPSLQALAFLRRNSAPRRSSTGTFLGVGDPVLARAAGGGARGLQREIAPADIFGAAADTGSAELATAEAIPANALADVDLLRQLPELEGTGRELRAMALALSQGDETLRLRERARETELKSADLSEVNVLAFATHGLLAGELKPGQSPGLVLTPPDVATAEDDGLLTAPEIARLKLAADWVILSACNTAAGDGSDGAAALSGLARSFFFAGARSLLVSHWPVLDELSSTITVKAITLQRSNPAMSAAEAFQKAQQDVRADRRWAHPRSWAPFAFIGDAAASGASTAVASR